MSGGNPSAIVSDQPTCDPEEQRVNNVDLARLDRMHRFLLLWRHTGWRIRDLDLMVMAPALGNGTIDGACLVRLWQVHRVQAALKLRPAEAHALFAEIDTGERFDEDLLEPEANLYQELFQNAAVSQPPPPEFALPLDGSALTGHRAPLIAALAITEEEMALLLPATDGTLTLASLSALYRRARLARALGLPVEDLVSLLALSSDIAPFGGPPDMLQLIERHATIRAARVPVRQLAFGLAAAPESPYGIREAVIAQHLQGLRGELVTLAQEFGTPDEPWRDWLGRQLPRVGSLSDETVLATALDLIQGHWTGTEAERLAFVATHFDTFIPAAANAAGTLTGGGPGPDVPLTPAQEAALMARVAFVAGHLHAWLTRKNAVRFAASVMALDDDVAAVLLNRLTLPGQGAPLLEVIRGDALTQRGANGQFVNPLTEAALPDQFATLRILQKAAAVLRPLAVDAAELDWLVLHHGDIGTVDFNALPIAAAPAQPLLPAWIALTELLDFHRSHPDPEGARLFDMLESASDPAVPVAQLVATLSQVMQWPQDELDRLRPVLGLRHAPNATDFARPATLTRIARCREMVRRSGTNVATLESWASRQGAAAEETRAETARRAVKSKYEPKEWLRRIEPIADEMRERRRDALVGWLVETSRRNQAPTVNVGGVAVPNLRRWDSPQDVSAWFLMDVEMSACQETSRIKFAIGSVQTFVQRCFLDLEKEFVRVPRNDPDIVNSWTQWRWLKSVRLRRASLEIFYHGENWIDPRLRDDKTPFFEQLEQDLMQKEMTPDNVETAFRGYVEKLDEVANLEIVSLFHDFFGDSERLHVVGRTRSRPHVHYYRSYDLDYGIWSPWEKIEMEIESDNVTVVVYNRQLHLMWLEVERKPQKVKKNPPVGDTSKSSDRADPPDMLEITLVWSVRAKTGWDRAGSRARSLSIPGPGRCSPTT